MWRWSRCESRTRRISARQRGEATRLPVAWLRCLSTSSTPHGSAERAARSTSPGGIPSALPKSRIAEREWKGRERRHERRAVVSVAGVHARDQHLADVAREVEVDVRQRRQLLVQEAAEEE